MLDEKRVILLLNQFERYYIEFLSHFPLTFDAYMRFADKLSYRNMKQHKYFILFQQEIKEYLKKNRNNNKIQNKKV